MVQVICWKSLRDAKRKELLRSRMLLVHDVRQREGDVKNLIAGKLEDLTPVLKGLATEWRISSEICRPGPTTMRQATGCDPAPILARTRRRA